MYSAEAARFPRVYASRFSSALTGAGTKPIAATNRAISASCVRTIVRATCAPRFLNPASNAIIAAVGHATPKGVNIEIVAIDLAGRQMNLTHDPAPEIYANYSRTPPVGRPASGGAGGGSAEPALGGSTGSAVPGGAGG